MKPFDLNNIEAVFEAGHQEIIAPITVAVDKFRGVCRELEMETVDSLRSELSVAKSVEDRDTLTARLHDAQLIGGNDFHPTAMANRGIKRIAQQVVMRAGEPLVTARREFLNEVRAAVEAEEKEFFGHWGSVPVKTVLHQQLSIFHHATNLLETQMTRFSASNWPVVIPHGLAKYGTPLPGFDNPIRPGADITTVDPRVRRTAMDCGWNLEEAVRVEEKAARTAALTERAKTESAAKREEIRRAKSRRLKPSPIIHQTVATSVDLPNPDAVEQPEVTDGPSVPWAGEETVAE